MLALFLAAGILADLRPVCRAVECGAPIPLAGLQNVLRRHKYALMAFSPGGQKKLGVLAAGQDSDREGPAGQKAPRSASGAGASGFRRTEAGDGPDGAARFVAIVLEALSVPPTVGRWRNAVAHMIGYITRRRPKTRSAWISRLADALSFDDPAHVLRPLYRAAAADVLHYLLEQSFLDPEILKAWEVLDG